MTPALRQDTAKRVAMLQAVARAEVNKSGHRNSESVKAATLLVLELAREAYLSIRHIRQAHAFVMVSCGLRGSTRIL